MDISWEDAQTFLAVAESGSFTAAARRLSLGQPTISRRVALLEEQTGCQLFLRGKSGAELTDEGGRLLLAAKEMARWAGEFRRLAAGAEAEPAGRVRIAAPPGLAVDFLAPFAMVVRSELPDIDLEVLASVDYLDLTRGSADLALRTLPPTEAQLIALASMEVEMGVFAAKQYAESLPSAPTLEALDWITWASPYEQLAPRPFLEERIPGFRPAFSSDNYLVQKSALLAGLGVMVLERQHHPLVREPSLVELDLGLILPSGSFHLVCAKSSQWIPRIRCVAELLQAQIPFPCL